MIELKLKGTGSNPNSHGPHEGAGRPEKDEEERLSETLGVRVTKRMKASLYDAAKLKGVDAMALARHAIQKEVRQINRTAGRSLG